MYLVKNGVYENMENIVINKNITKFLNNVLSNCFLSKCQIINNFDEICPICLQIQKSYKLPCNHIFHKNCITEWITIQQNCPVCRLRV